MWRILTVNKYKGCWMVRYLKNGANPAWPLGSLGIKTHGLISYPDMLFATKEEAVDYAMEIAEKMNFHFETECTIVRVQETPCHKEENIECRVSKIADLAHIDFKPPSTEINQFGRIKHKA